MILLQHQHVTRTNQIRPFTTKIHLIHQSEEYSSNSFTQAWTTHITSTISPNLPHRARVTWNTDANAIQLAMCRVGLKRLKEDTLSLKADLHLLQCHTASNTNWKQALWIQLGLDERKLYGDAARWRQELETLKWIKLRPATRHNPT